jgi:hypothetical protein
MIGHLALGPTDPVDVIVEACRAQMERTCESDVICADCDRHLCRLSAYYHRQGAHALPRILSEGGVITAAPDYCRWCARPLSERARAREVIGYVRLAQLTAREPAELVGGGVGAE